jgi:hypothetical protein
MVCYDLSKRQAEDVYVLMLEMRETNAFNFV